MRGFVRRLRRHGKAAAVQRGRVSGRAALSVQYCVLVPVSYHVPQCVRTCKHTQSALSPTHGCRLAATAKEQTNNAENAVSGHDLGRIA